MEVVEHILHFVSMTGLHYTFFEEWGVNRSSQQYTHMNDAISKRYYNIKDYGNKNNDENARVMLQEYAYWVITTSWDIQETYGPSDAGNGEWSLQNFN